MSISWWKIVVFPFNKKCKDSWNTVKLQKLEKVGENIWSLFPWTSQRLYPFFRAANHPANYFPKMRKFPLDDFLKILYVFNEIIPLLQPISKICSLYSSKNYITLHCVSVSDATTSVWLSSVLAPSGQTYAPIPSSHIQQPVSSN